MLSKADKEMFKLIKITNKEGKGTILKELQRRN